MGMKAKKWLSPGVGVLAMVTMIIFLLNSGHSGAETMLGTTYTTSITESNQELEFLMDSELSSRMLAGARPHPSIDATRLTKPVICNGKLVYTKCLPTAGKGKVPETKGVYKKY